MNYSPLIYAFEQENIAVTGEGTLDGSRREAGGLASAGAATAAAKNSMDEAARRAVPVAERVFGEGGGLRPNFIQPYRCRTC